MTEAYIKAKIKEILKEPLLKDILKDGEPIICKFCGWRPKWIFVHKQSSLLTHLAYNHKGKYKTKVDKLYDFFLEVAKNVH